MRAKAKRYINCLFTFRKKLAKKQKSEYIQIIESNNNPWIGDSLIKKINICFNLHWSVNQVIIQKFKLLLRNVAKPQMFTWKH